MGRLPRAAADMGRARPSRLAALQAITAALVTVRTPADAAQVVLSKGLAALGAAGGSIRILSEDGAHLVRLSPDGYSADMLAASPEILPLAAPAPVCSAVRTREAVFLADSDAYERHFPAFAAAHTAGGYHACAALPLLIGGRILGCLMLSYAPPQRFRRPQRAYVATLAELVTQAIERTRLHEADRARAEAAEELARLRAGEVAEAAVFEEMGAALGAALDLRVLYSLILAQVTRVLPCDHACVAMYDGEGITFEAAWGTPHIAQGTSFPRRALWFPEVQRAPVYVPDVLALPGWFAVPPLTGALHDRSLIATPLCIDGRAVGSFDVSSRTPHLYTPNHLRLAARFAEHVTHALRNARLYAAERARARIAEELAETRQEQAEEEVVLARIGAALGESLVPERLYALILEQAGRVLPGDFAVVALYVDGWATVVAALGDPSPPAGTRLFPADTDRMWLPDPSLPLSYVPDSMDEPRWQDLPPWLGANRRRSVISVPLRVDGIILGDFSFASRVPHAYGERHLRLAGLCAERASQAVRNARLFAAEQARARAAEELVRTRDDFVASVSHELRTPLTAIVGFGELLEARWGATEDAHRRATVRKIVASAHRQQRLVDDLLQLSRLDSASPDVRLVPTALRPLLARAAEEVRLSYPGQGVDLAGPPGLLVLADGDRVLQVAANLVDNAAKYSPEGSMVAVGWQAEGEWAAVRVRDHGLGIPDSHRGVLFSRFGRVPGSRIRSGHVGTGLGLYLSRRLTTAMGGELALESSGPEGSTFLLRLPLVPDSPVG